MVPEDGGAAEVGEAGAQALLQVQLGEEGLHEDQAAEGGQGLVLEAEDGKLMEFAMDRGSAMFHLVVASRGIGGVVIRQLHRSQWGGHRLRHSASVRPVRGWTSPLVRSSGTSSTAFSPAFHAAPSPRRPDFSATWGFILHSFPCV
jgi:hypothetical protein